MDIQPLAENQYELGKVKNTAIAAPAISPEQNPELEDSTEPVKLRSKLRLYAVMAGLNLAVFTAAMDQTIIATAAPTITNELHSAAGYVWISGAYFLANAAAGPLWTKISDIWGRKPIILTALVMFLCSSIICATATSMKILIVGRSLQGTGAGGIIRIAMITISDIFSVRHRTFVYGILEVVWVIAGGIGPVLGGILTERLSWRWAFWINMPICTSTILLLFFFLDVHNPRTPVLKGLKAIDWFGSISILAMTLMVLLGLEFGGASFPWNSPRVISLLVVGSLLSLVFIYSERRLAKYPLMPMELFKNRSNVGNLLVTFFHGMTYISSDYYLPLYFQSVFSASPARSGVLIMPMIVTESSVAMINGLLMHRTGRYLESIYVGTIIMTLGNGLFILFTSHSSLAQIIGIEIIAGLGQGLLFQAPLISIQAHSTPAATATATSTWGFTNNLATTLGVVLNGVIFQNSMTTRVALLPPSTPSNITSLLGSDHAAANAMIVAFISDPALAQQIKDAFVWSLRNMWIFTTCIASLSVVASLFIQKAVLSREHVEVKTGLLDEEPVVRKAEVGAEA